MYKGLPRGILAPGRHWPPSDLWTGCRNSPKSATSLRLRCAAMTSSLDLLSDLISRARGAGADSADTVLISGTSISVQRRLGKVEHVERSEGRDLGLRVFVERKAAVVSATTVDPGRFAELAERAVAMARVVPDDPYGGLAETVAAPEQAALELEDPGEPEVE